MHRPELIRIFNAGVAAADPVAAVAASLRADPLPDPSGRRVVIAVGKAAIGMAQGAAPLARDTTLIVTNPENARDVTGARVFAAAHPVPDAVGLAAGDAVIEVLGSLEPGDQVLCLISGGASALLPAPVAGVTLKDKAAVNATLLASGADIVEMNMIRQHLSRLKGGGLVALAGGADVQALILSDVVGDDLRVIASGPTVAQIGSKAEAVAALRARGVWSDLPDAVQRVLLSGDKPVTSAAAATNRLVGSNSISVHAMATAAGPKAQIAENPLEGDVQTAAEHLLSLPKGLHLMGGETTVQIKGTGKGGRNQELALRVAAGAKARGWTNWTFLSGGTDGRDGPTEAAGGIVDQGTCARITAAGGDITALLANNDSNAGLALAGDLLLTGGTGTNVADLQILWRD